MKEFIISSENPEKEIDLDENAFFKVEKIEEADVFNLSEDKDIILGDSSSDNFNACCKIRYSDKATYILSTDDVSSLSLKKAGVVGSLGSNATKAAAAGPDLVPYNLKIKTAKQPFPLNSYITFQFNVANIGTTSSGSFMASIYMNGNLLGNMTWLPSIAPNSAIGGLEVDINSTYAGMHELSIVVNRNKAVTESDYNNNTIAADYAWANPNTVDLAYHSIVCTPNPITANTDVSMQVIVANYGAAPVLNIPVWFSYKEGVNGTWKSINFTINSINSMQAKGTVITGRFYTPGTVYVVAEVDPYGWLNDRNLNNNRGEEQYQVTAAALAWPTESKSVSRYNTSSHDGADISPKVDRQPGDEVYAYADGYVARAEKLTNEGNFVSIHHVNPIDNGYAHIRTYYMHLQSPALVSATDEVTAGQLIGYMGNTGNVVPPASSGPGAGTHLHFEVSGGTAAQFPLGGPSSYATGTILDSKTYLDLAR